MGPSSIELEAFAFDDSAGTQLMDLTNRAGTAGFADPTPQIRTDGRGAIQVSQNPLLTEPPSGDFIVAGPLTFGARTMGIFEMEFTIEAADFTGGDASGALVGFALRDATADVNIYAIRLNQTVAGLAVSSFIDSTYTRVYLFSGQSALTAPLQIRSVVDFGNRRADVFLTIGAGAELKAGTVALGAQWKVWDQFGLITRNNSTDWGAEDFVKIGDFSLRKIDLDRYARWVTRTNWRGSESIGTDDDPDRDSIPNFLEFALGGSPDAG